MGFFSTVCTRSANLCRSCLSAPSPSICPALRACSAKPFMSNTDRLHEMFEGTGRDLYSLGQLHFTTSAAPQ